VRSDWQGELLVGRGWAVWRGAVGDNRLHRHLAAQAVLADEPLSAETACGVRVEARVLLIDPLTPHRLAQTRRARIVFVEPAGRLPPGLADELAARGDDVACLQAQEGRFRFWLQDEGPAVPEAQEPPWGDTVLALIDRSLAAGRVRLSDAAAASGLSAERFRHVFAESYGLPFKRFVLWRRLQTASAALIDGGDATGAAHAAGFADSAHFTRTMKTMLGVQPSQFLRTR
jgi:AraC-like DNA-binding protein